MSYTMYDTCLTELTNACIVATELILYTSAVTLLDCILSLKTHTTRKALTEIAPITLARFPPVTLNYDL